MVLKRRFIVALTTFMSLLIVFFGATTVDAARSDMVDVSNYNGAMTVANFQDMHNNYGVKAVVTKISEGTSFKDVTAANNIATAQSAGMYISGYHYAHYSSVSGAIAEADYAARTAQADGLPKGSVLVADVESSEQSASSVSQNNADNAAFMNEVAKYGYRSTIYTMGSWVGSVMNVSQGWIASYPYDPTGQDWYTSNHGWQWSSTSTFSGSYGNFDVSELYDSFFTSYQSTTGSTTTTTGSSSTNSGSTSTTGSSSSTTSSTTVSGTSVINVNNASGNFVPLVSISSDGGTVQTLSSRALSNHSSWQTDQTKTVGGVAYYRVATNEWVAANYLTGGNSNSSQSSSTNNLSVIKVKNSNASFVQLKALQDDGTMKDVTNRALGNNTSWQTDQTKVVSGVTYYRVATNEWVAGSYIIS
ncbi:GH25 family lysozyme [Companilactobacillus heilongjiangensis]|uniref:GH25 family lysozyme n=1 Tax=Companilactobacillus heilongjiangensis TaxID=1074467 RepID=UPI00069DB04A|nr:GH25 family lysozyme [Companilactobacillus heilongjiangensis]